jgi:outer membrane protein assembly factor BamB
MRRTAFLVFVVLLMAGCPKKNHAPDAPSMPVGPTVVAEDSTASFSSAATDPDADSVSIRFDWGDGDTSEWSNWVASGDTVTMSHLWADTGTFQLKTQAKDRQDSTSAWSATLSISITPNRPPNTPAVPSGPSAAPKDSTCLFTTSAPDPDGDSVSYRFAWGNGDTSAWGGWTLSGSPGGAGYAYLRSGSFQVRAQARDADDARSAWSNPLSVSIRNPYPASTPSAPIGPDTGRLRETLGFSCAASDSGGDSVSIRFSWGDGDTSEWSTMMPSGYTVRVTHAWQDAGSFPVKAQAKDEEGLTSSWSSSSTVTITRLKWRYQTGNYVESSPAVAADGTIYVGSKDSCLYAINPDGSLKWRYQTGGYIFALSPSVAADGTVYVGSCDGYLYAVNSSGSLRWRYQIGVYLISSPAVAADGTVCVGSVDSCLYAINRDGSLKWRYQTGNYVESSPAVAADGTIHVGSGDSCLYAINPDGSLGWRYQTSYYVSSPAVAADGTVYVGSDGYLYAVNSNGSLKWRYQTNFGISSSPAVAADGTVYVGSEDGYLYAINPDGSLKCRYRAGGSISSSPAIAADGTVYVGSADRYLYAVNPDGSLKWRYQTGNWVGSSPAVAADGTVYVGSCDNYLYAIIGDSPLAASPWPKFHHDNKNTGRVGGGQR